MQRFFSRWGVSGLCLAMIVALAVPAAALAAPKRGKSGPTQAQIQQMQKQQQQQLAAQKKEQERQQKAFMAKFDTNKNGKIDAGQEKAAVDKYKRELELGKAKPL